MILMPIIADTIEKASFVYLLLKSNIFFIASNLHITSRHVNIMPTTIQLKNDQ